MKEKKFPGRDCKKLVWEPKGMRGRGLSQQEGILTLRFDYGQEQLEPAYFEETGRSGAVACSPLLNIFRWVNGPDSRCNDTSMSIVFNDY
jgi:hypothetical protein